MNVVLELYQHPSLGPCVRIDEGAVTGHESLVLKNLHPNHDLRWMMARGWTACAGTPRSYDKLWIPPIQMIKALAELGLA